MPAKGQRYAKVDIALDKWAKAWLEENQMRPAHLARALGKPNRFAHDLLKGKINTIYTLDLIVNKLLGGNYEAMAKYALTPAAKTVLEDLQFNQGLTKEELEIFRQMRNRLKKALKKGDKKAVEKAMQKFEEVIQEELDKHNKS